MKSILEQLSAMTVVVADTGDIDAIKKFKPTDATTNPSLILAAAKNPNYIYLIDKSLENAKKLFSKETSDKELVKEAMEHKFTEITRPAHVRIL